MGHPGPGQYTVRFTPAPLDLDSANPISRPETRHLTIDERAVSLLFQFVTLSGAPVLIAHSSWSSL